MNALLRVLGINLLESVAARTNPVVATVVQFILVIGGSLLPIIPLATGAVQLQDLLVYTVAWMALSVVGTLIRMSTLAKQTDTTRFFMLHYAIMIGILSLVCGVWAVILLFMAGPSGGWFALVPMAAALVLANAWSLADGWFVRGGRYVARTWQVLLPGYLRFVPLLLATVFGAVTIIGNAPSATKQLVAIGLVLAQALIDLSLLVASMRMRR